MAGQDAVTAAKEFHEQVEITGVVLTKLDGDARGGAALSIRSVLGVPVKFIGVGERTDALEPFHPDRLAGRILGMGDMLSLIDKAKATMGDQDTERFNEKMRKGSFDLQDFVDQLRQVREMGPIGQLVQMLPGFNSIKSQLERGLAGRVVLRARGGDRAFDDGLGAPTSGPHRREAAAAHRAGQRHRAGGREPAAEAVLRGAQARSADQHGPHAGDSGDALSGRIDGACGSIASSEKTRGNGECCVFGYDGLGREVRRTTAW